MTCRITKTWKRTPLGFFAGFKREEPPRLDIMRLINSGAVKIMPANCWLSRALRLFRREGRVM